ncbi:N6AMT1 family protein [Megaselia abdita]
METPSISHLTSEDLENVYEPAEDSFLLLDALEKDLEYLREELKPKVCLEIGSGSGIIITSVAKYVQCLCLSTDINAIACSVTKRTASENPPASVDTIQMNLVDGIRKNSVDLLLFNPPYVVTEDEELTSSKMSDGQEITSKNLVYTWAGGENGRRVIDVLLNNLDDILAEGGVLYLLVLKENKPKEIIEIVRKKGFHGEVFMERRIPGEYLYILKIVKKKLCK